VTRPRVPPHGTTRPRVLVYRALGLGDLLCGIPALRGVRDAFPGHEVVLAAPRALEPLATLSGAVDAVADTAPLAVPDVRGADVAVNLHGRGPESHRAVLATRPRRLVAFACGAVPESRPGPSWRPGEHEVDRWCRLLRESGLPADPRRLDLPSPPWPAPAGAAGATLIHPGAASAARRWPAARWAAVAEAERRAGRRVVLTGSAAERPLAEGIAHAAGLPADAVLAGRTDLRALSAAVAAAARVVCGDTGVAHLATALGTPSVVLFGPTPPAEWGPPADRPQHVALHHGGRGDPHGGEPDPGLLEITVEEVLGAAA
jgi:ADP-heptose:LPS heptosyltransferase